MILVNNLRCASNLLDPIIFADENNFFVQREIKTIFDTVRIELQKNSQWFLSNNLSLNVKRTKYILFHKPSKKDDILLVLLKLNICYNEIKRSESIKFLGDFLDEILTWKSHIKYTENKTARKYMIIIQIQTIPK